MSEQNKPDPTICPACGGSNQCAQLQATNQPCWCQQLPAVNLPMAAESSSCYCPNCLQLLASSAADLATPAQ